MHDNDLASETSLSNGQSSDLAAVEKAWPGLKKFLGKYREISKIPDTAPDGKPLQEQRRALAKFYPEHFKNGRSGLWVADPAYVRDRLEKWASLTDKLSTDPVLITARQKWAQYGEAERIDTLRHIGRVTMDALGSPDENIHVNLRAADKGLEYAEYNSTVTYYLNMDHDGYVLKDSKLFNNFENMAAGMVHETFHADQENLQRAKPENLTMGERLQREYISLAGENYIRARGSELQSHPDRVVRDAKLYYFNPKEGESNLALENIGKNGESAYPERGWKQIIGNPEQGREMSAMLRQRGMQIEQDLQKSIDQGKPYDFVHCRFDKDDLASAKPAAAAFKCSFQP